MFCRMESLHLCSPQGQYGKGQDSPLRSCFSCEWLKACVLSLFSLPRFSLECCAVKSFVSFHSHLNNAVCKMKIITDYCSEPTAHSRDRSHLDHRFSQNVPTWGTFQNKWLFSHNKHIYNHCRLLEFKSPDDFSHESSVEWEMGVSCERDGCVLSLLSLDCL